jgi:Cu/Zn superoxide dismutase
VRRITKAAIGGLAGVTLVLGGTQAANGALVAKEWFRDTLTDLLTADGPFDSAKAKITIAERTNGTTTFRIRVRGIDPSIAGETLGSHLHTGKCVEGDTGTPADGDIPATIPGGLAGPHYNHQVVAEGKVFPTTALPSGPNVAEINADTEVWFNLVPDEEGIAFDETTVPFVPRDPDGFMAVVIHVMPTDPNTGKAGDRQACFPLSVPQWIPKASE